MELIVAAAVAAILAIGAVSYFANRIGVAAPLLLVVVGIGVSLIPGFPQLTSSPMWSWS